MKNIQLTAKFKIQEGQVDQFKKIAADCVNAVKNNEKTRFNTTGSFVLMSRNALSAKLMPIRMQCLHTWEMWENSSVNFLALPPLNLRFTEICLNNCKMQQRD